MNNQWNTYPCSKPPQGKWLIVVDATNGTFTNGTFKGKTIAVQYGGDSWTFLDPDKDYEDAFVTHWMELPTITNYNQCTTGWFRFPVLSTESRVWPPEGKDLFVIDCNISPIVFNLATYSIYDGWKLLMPNPSTMRVTHWYVLPDSPEPTAPVDGWNAFPAAVPSSDKSVLVAARREKYSPVYFVCANWRNGHFNVDFNDHELDNEDIMAWRLIDDYHS